MGDLLQFFNPKLELDRLKYESISLIRMSREIMTMKGLIYCYDILDLTERINRPWDVHPGGLFADMTALIELKEKSASLIVHQDPTAEKIHNYNQAIQRLVFFWQLSMENNKLIGKF